MNEQQLLNAASAGDERAYAELVEAHRGCDGGPQTLHVGLADDALRRKPDLRRCDRPAQAYLHHAARPRRELQRQRNLLQPALRGQHLRAGERVREVTLG